MEDITETPQTIDHLTNRPRVIFLIIGLTVLVLGLTYAAVLAQNRQQPTPTPSITPTPSPVDETVYTEATRSANWKTYIDPKGKFELSHPESWILNSQALCCITTVYFDELINSFDGTQEARSVINTKQDFLTQKRTINSGKLPPEFSSRSVLIKALKVDGANAVQRYSYKMSGGVYTIDTIIFTDKVRIDISQNLPVKTIDKPLANNPAIQQVDIEQSIIRLNEIAKGTFDTEIQTTVDEHNQILSTFKFLDSASPTPTCIPRPRCLDQEPRCLMPESENMCPPKTTPTGNPNQVACTQEAKLCPDGSYVSRTGPKCEFAPCP